MKECKVCKTLSDDNSEYCYICGTKFDDKVLPIVEDKVDANSPNVPFSKFSEPIIEQNNLTGHYETDYASTSKHTSVIKIFFIFIIIGVLLIVFFISIGNSGKKDNIDNSGNDKYTQEQTQMIPQQQDAYDSYSKYPEDTVNESNQDDEPIVTAQINDGSSLDKAKPISVNEPVTDFLDSSSDNNWYKMILESSGTIIFDFSHELIETDDNLWNLCVYDSQNYDGYEDDLTPLMYTNYKGKDRSSSSQTLGLPSGTYYIRIMAYNGYHSYSTMSYTLTVTFSDTELCEKEGNDSADSASELTVNNPYIGCTDDYEDIDWYVFTLSTSGTVTFNFSHELIETDNNLWALCVYDSQSYDGYEDDLTPLMYTNYKGKDRSSSSQALELPAGTYYIRIMPHNGYHSYSTIPYVLTALVK